MVKSRVKRPSASAEWLLAELQRLKKMTDARPKRDDVATGTLQICDFLEQELPEGSDWHANDGSAALAEPQTALAVTGAGVPPKWSPLLFGR